MPNQREIRQQSENAYKQWCEQWREQAKTHSKYEMKSLQHFSNSGVGKAALCVANGYTFEMEIENIKKHRDQVDILACDKTLGPLLDNGISPDFLLLCDANVSYEEYCEPWADKLQDTILFANVCANPQWAEKGKWKDKYFFVNKDILESEKEFIKLSGCPNVIPAGTNVSNAQVVFLTQSDDRGRRNFFGYDKILLIGFDYSWLPQKYYAFNHTGQGKDSYMRHVYTVNNNNNFCYTSTNLQFSARWLSKYVNVYKLPIVQCSKESILAVGETKDLSQQMQYNFKREDSALVRELIQQRENIIKNLNNIKNQLKDIAHEHHSAYIASV